MISDQDIRAAVFGAQSKLPRICSNGRQLRDMSDDALRALQGANEPPVLFARSGQMVAVVRDEKRRLVIAELGVDGLCGHLTRSADYFRVTAKLEEVGCPPPPVVAKDILALAPAIWQFPSLDAIVAVPIIRPDGTILDSPGYDPETQLFYAPDPCLRLPAIAHQPTSDHIEIALDLIDQTIGEFPFENEASRANAVAAVLTPIIKPAINAPSPIALLDAPQAGTGKSLLCDVIAIIATGTAGEMFSAPTDQDEWRKVITTALLSGTSVVIFDNISHPLENADLCSALTATTWADRAMRTHSKISLPIKATFFASGNNIRLAGDMPRRCYQIRLNAKSSQPHLRSGPEPGKNFRIPDLKSWTTEHRGELLAALLTLARAWYAAGKPKARVKPVGGFEAWTMTIGGILEFAGVPGFLENADSMYEDADDESREWEGFLLKLSEIFYSEPFSVADIMVKLNEKTHPGGTELTGLATSFRATLPGFLAEALSKDGTLQRRMGIAFGQRAERRFGDSGVHLKRGTIATGKQQWGVIFPR